MRMTRRLLVSALAACGLLPAKLAAQVTDGGLHHLLSRPLNAATLASLRQALGTPGMALFWQTGSAPPVVMADGFRAAGNSAPVTTQDQWHLGSITKSLTATVFARAVEAGVIGWDTPIGNVLPRVPRRHRTLTAIDLLSHHAGLAKDIPLGELFAMPMIEADARSNRRRYAEMAFDMRPVGPAHSGYSYSNAGYVLAAHMLEEVTGVPYETLAQREVLTPLGLASAGFGPPGSPEQFNQPRGHQNGQPVWADNPAVMAPAGGLHMALGDVATYLRAHRDRAPLLRHESWAQLHKPRFGSTSALGWIAGQDGSLWHNGSNTHWYAEVLVEPQTGLIVGHCGNDMALFTHQRALLPALRQAAMGLQ